MSNSIIESFQRLVGKSNFDPTDLGSVSEYLEDHLLNHVNATKHGLTPKISNRSKISPLTNVDKIATKHIEENMTHDFFNELQREVKKTTCDKKSQKFDSNQRRLIADIVNYLENEISEGFKKKGNCLYEFLDNQDSIDSEVKEFITEAIYKTIGKVREQNNIQGKLPHPNDHSISKGCFGWP